MPPAIPAWTRSCLAALLVAVAAAPVEAQPKKPPRAASAEAARQFRDAAAFQDRGVYDLAADEWEAFLKKFASDPLAPQARHYLGVCRLLLKQYDAAVAQFQRVLGESPDSELADSSYLNLGLAQYSIAQAGQAEAYDAAAATLATLAEKFPQSQERPQALYYRGEALYARGHKEQAADAYRQLIEQHPQSSLAADALYAWGVALQEQGRHDAAAAVYDRFLQDHGAHKQRAEVTMRRGEASYSQQNFLDAAQRFAAAAELPGFALADLAALRQAQSLEAAGKPAEAAPLYAAMAERFPQSAYRGAALLAAGNCHVAAGDLAAAEGPLSAVIEAGGELADDAAHWLARALLKQQRPEQALGIIERVLPSAAGADFEPALRMDEADALFEIPERRGESVALYAALANEHADHALAPQALYMAAFAALGQREFQTASDHCAAFAARFAEHPLAAEVGYVAAEAALQLQHYDQAQRQYGTLAERYPGHADAPAWTVRRALALHLDRKFAEVAELLGPRAAALPAGGLAAEAQFLLGSAHAELGHGAEAEAALEAALAAEPRGKHAEQALLTLAAVKRQAADLPGAIAVLERLAAEFPQSKLLEQARYRQGEYSAAAGDLVGAAAHYRQLVEAAPRSPLAPHALYGLGSALFGQNEFAAAAAALSRLLDEHPDHALLPQARYVRALARERQGEHAAALDDLAGYLAADPPADKRLEALYVRGLCQVGLQQFAPAAETFRALVAAEPPFAGADKAQYELAWALRSAGKPAEALEAFRSLARDRADSPLAAEALYHLGEHAYEARDFREAADHYTQARDKSGGGELAEKAAHKLGWSQYQQGELAAASATFAEQLEKFPDGPLAADALFMAAESLFAQKQFEAALAAYDKSFARPGDNREFQALARLHAAQALAQAKKWDASLAMLDAALTDYAQSAYLPELRYESAWALQNLGRADEAMARYEQVADETEREVSARARFMVGELLFEKRDYKEAVRSFFKVAYGYGYPQSPEAIHPWQANASYEAARCFEVLRMFEQAKKSYQEIVDRYPTSDKAPLARTRLEALGA